MGAVHDRLNEGGMQWTKHEGYYMLSTIEKLHNMHFYVEDI